MAPTGTAIPYPAASPATKAVGMGGTMPASDAARSIMPRACGADGRPYWQVRPGLGVVRSSR